MCVCVGGGIYQPERLEGTVHEAHVRPGIVPVPKCQSGKLYHFYKASFSSNFQLRVILGPEQSLGIQKYVTFKTS